MYIIFNGTDGAGKDTQMQLFLKDNPEYDVIREPGGHPISEIIRQVILHPELSIERRVMMIEGEMGSIDIVPNCLSLLEKANKELKANGLTGMAEAYLYAASRAQTNQVIIKNNKNKKYIGTRSVACSMAYQGFARGIGMDEIWKLNQQLLDGAYPVVEIFMYVSADEASKRLKKRVTKQDRLDKESIDFFKKVEEGYNNYYKKYCPYPYELVNAGGSVEETYEKIKSILKKIL